jgi:hypothetical protein
LKSGQSKPDKRHSAFQKTIDNSKTILKLSPNNLSNLKNNISLPALLWISKVCQSPLRLTAIKSLLIILSLLPILYVDGQSQSVSPVQNQNQQIENLQLRDTLSRSLDKVEAQSKALDAADKLVQSQNELIEMYKRLDESRKREVDALKLALDASSKLTQAQMDRATVSEQRVEQLEKRNGIKGKLTKYVAIVGFVLLLLK